MRYLLFGCLGWFAAHAADTSAVPALSLAEARRVALLHHPRVQLADLQAQIAQSEITVARAAYLPTANAYFDAVGAANNNTRILAGGITNSAIYDRTADGIAVSQLLTDFGRTSNLIASAQLAARASAAGADASREQIILAVDIAYFRALAADQVLAVARSTVDDETTLTNQISALAHSRLRSDLDVSFAQVGLEQSQLELQQAEGGVASAAANLSAALGEKESQRYALARPADATEPTADPDVDAAIVSALTNRPDLAQLRLQREAAGRAARAEKDRNYPVVAAIGEAGNALTHDDRLPNRYAVGGITVDLPLFAGGSYVARTKAARLRTDVAEQTLRQAEDEVSRDVRLAWINWQTATLRARTVKSLVTHANDAYQLAQARYRVGSSSIVELNQAQLSATHAQIQAADADYTALLARSALDYQTGRLR